LKSSGFDLGKDKDGRFFADPTNLDQLDDFRAHEAAAEELNAQRDLLAKIRSTLVPLDGSELDKNPREGIIAVTGLAVDGKSVDAVVSANRNKGLFDVDARACGDGNAVTLAERFRDDGKEEPIIEMRVGLQGRSYYVTDHRNGSTRYWVRVK
jgi:hypothetical protein